MQLLYNYYVLRMISNIMLIIYIYIYDTNSLLSNSKMDFKIATPDTCMENSGILETKIVVLHCNNIACYIAHQIVLQHASNKELFALQG